MELKDVILSTLAEMEVSEVEQTQPPKKTQIKQKSLEVEQVSPKVIKNNENLEPEQAYLNSIRERLLVLFDGFQAPNNVNIEAKVDLTLNFLEYVLATIDSRLEILEDGSKKI